MARPSKIDRLPREVRDRIGKLREAGCTIDEILAKLQELELDVEISRAGLARHTRKLDAIGRRIRESRAAATAIMTSLEKDKDNRLARFNIELMHANLQALLGGEDGEEVKLTPQEAMFLGRTLRDLAGAAKTDADREIKVREEVAKQHAAKLDSAVQDAAAAGEKGLSAERIAQLRRDFLGVR